MKIALKKADGTVSIMTVADDLNQDEIQRIIRKWEQVNVKAVSHHHVLSFPDKHFRNAWEYEDGGLKINMDKARDIHLQRIRLKRDKALEKLDIETLKGKDVQAEKQKLRDLPQTIDLKTANTPEELKNLWPEELKE